MSNSETATAREVILIVDDDAISRDLVATVLKRHGYCILFAQNGPQAIEIATQEHPDLILMDMKLPGISGCEAVQRLKSQPETAAIPIVALTANAFAMARQRAMDAGCAGYFVKPIDTRALPGQLRQYLRQDDLSS
jgi:CheY-like chemotaxis protein